MVNGHAAEPHGQTNLRRALSTAYYAMFHALAHLYADHLVGATEVNRSEPAWFQVYRSLEHGQAKERCTRNRSVLARFPQAIQDFGKTFAEMQERRHSADYDPEAHFTLAIVVHYLEKAETAIQGLQSTHISESDRRAFAVFILFKRRTLGRR